MERQSHQRHGSKCREAISECIEKVCSCNDDITDNKTSLTGNSRDLHSNPNNLSPETGQPELRRIKTENDELFLSKREHDAAVKSVHLRQEREREQESERERERARRDCVRIVSPPSADSLLRKKKKEKLLCAAAVGRRDCDLLNRCSEKREPMKQREHSGENMCNAVSAPPFSMFPLSVCFSNLTFSLALVLALCFPLYSIPSIAV